MRTFSLPRFRSAAILPLAVLFVACSDVSPDPVGPPELSVAENNQLAAIPFAPPAYNLLGLPNSAESVAEDVNNRGAVAGHWGDRAYLWKRGAFRFLPSLGGDASRAFGLNNRNIVVGQSQNAAGDFHATLWEGKEQPLDLGTPGGTTSTATDINRAGTVVGFGDNGAGETRGFVWLNGSLHVLNPRPGDQTSAAFAINRRGTIVGASCTGAICVPVRWKGSNPKARVLKNFPAGSGLALDINDRNRVVGVYAGPAGPIVGFTWRRGNVDLIPHPTDPTRRVDAAAINNRGVVAGSIDVGGQAFVWKDGSMDILPTLGGAGFDGARGINNRGVIAGRSATPGGQGLATVWGLDPWQFWSVQEVGQLPGHTQSIAHDVNDLGEVVGESWLVAGDPGAFVFDGAMTDLGDLGGGEATASAINNPGQITGGSLNGGGVFEAFLWDGGVMTGLGVLDPLAPFPFSVGEDINDNGWIVGSSGEEGFRWIAPGPLAALDLGPAMGTDRRAKGVNNGGVIAGTFSVPGISNAVRWEPGAGAPPLPATIEVLSNLNNQGRANGINDLGQIVGFFDGPFSKEAYVWDSGTVTTIFPTGIITEANAINGESQIVGTGGTGVTFAFTFKKGWISVLPSIQGAPNGDQANGLNEAGVVVGAASNLLGHSRAVIWTKN